LSCRQNSRRALLSAASTGINSIGGQVGYTAGMYLSQINDVSLRGLGAAAWVTGIAGPSPSPGRRPRLREKAAAGGGKALLKAAGLVDPVTRVATRAVKITEKVSGALGSEIADLTKTDEAGEVIQKKRKLLFFTSKEPVTLWKSSVTGLLNRRDVMVEAKRVKSSVGVMFKIKGDTWHHGTITVRTSSGTRPMTHLQSLKIPAAHYFFERQLTNEQAVGIAAGTTDPRPIPGYAGQVSAGESLSPAWSNVKQILIKSYLHQGGKSLAVNATAGAALMPPK